MDTINIKKEDLIEIHYLTIKDLYKKLKIAEQQKKLTNSEISERIQRLGNEASAFHLDVEYDYDLLKTVAIYSIKKDRVYSFLNKKYEKNNKKNMKKENKTLIYIILGFLAFIVAFSAINDIVVTHLDNQLETSDLKISLIEANLLNQVQELTIYNERIDKLEMIEKHQNQTLQTLKMVDKMLPADMALINSSGLQ